MKIVQKEMLEVETRQWYILREQYKVIQITFQVSKECVQLLFSRQQVKFKCDTLASLLAITFAIMKVYRQAQFTLFPCV